MTIVSWRTDFRPASFRGVEFYVRRAGSQGGRRGQDHEYPQREEGWAEDLGRQSRRFTLVGFLLGDDHREQAERLRKALEEPGPGTLDHPHMGEVEVVIRTWRLSDADLETGGETVVELQGVEAGGPRAPVASDDTRAQADTAAGGAEAAAADAFAAAWSVLGLPSAVAEAAAIATAAAAERLLGAWGRVLVRAVDPAAAFVRAVARLRDDGPALPAADLASTVRDAGDGFRRAAEPETAAAALAPVASGPAGSVVPAAPAGATSAAARIAANDIALDRLVRRLLLVVWVRVEVARPVASRRDAALRRDALLAAVDAAAEEAAAAGEDDLFAALLALRHHVQRHMAALAGRAAPVIGYSLAAPQPALVAAWRFYGDARREGELADRNAVWHPAFLPAEGERLAR